MVFMTIRRMYPIVFLVLLQLFACGGGQSENPIEEKIRASSVSEAEHDRLAAALPEGALETMSPLDTLFLAYNHPAFQPVQIDEAQADRWVDSLVNAFTLDEKIGQLFIVNMPGSSLRNLMGGSAIEAVEKYHVGGFLMPRLLAPEDVFQRTQALQRRAKVPLFFAADYERGVGRFNNPLTELPSNMAIGATRDTVFAAAAGRLSAIESRAIGINLLFAPVVDVNNNPDNPIINIRSYGEEPELVGRMGAAYVHEAESHGVLTTLKHFPGHGNTSVDSHAHLGTIQGSRQSLRQTEIKPYEIILGQPKPPAGIMTAHLWIRALDDRPIPATFSRNALTNLLRDELDFDGFVVTDDVKMGALANDYSLSERVIRPLLAGADIILTPADLGAAVNVLKAAVKDGRVEERRIDQSVRRILRAKARAGLHINRFADESALKYLMESPRGAYIAQSMANRAVTLLRTAPALPLKPDQRIGLVQLSNYKNSEAIGAAMGLFAKSLGENVVNVQFDDSPSRGEIASTLDRMRDMDVVVLSLYQRLVAGRGNAGLNTAQAQLVRQLLDAEVPVILVTFGNPYAVNTFGNADAFLVAYDQALETASAAADVLTGRLQPRGKLPITVGPFSYGSGLEEL